MYRQEGSGQLTLLAGGLGPCVKPGRKAQFLALISKTLDWQVLEKRLKRDYHPGKSSVGGKAYTPILLFKMLLVGVWYGSLSDYEVEDLLNDSLSVREFCNLGLQDSVPDHSVLSRFRTSLSQLEVLEDLLTLVNHQVESAGLSLRSGSIIDASLTSTPRRPRGKAPRVISEQEGIPSPQQERAGVDPQGGWTKKGGQYHYGYKKHVITDTEYALVRAVVTTPAHVHDTKCLERLVDKVSPRPGTPLLADKGYASAYNRSLLKQRGLEDGIMDKAARNRPLTAQQKKRNAGLTQIRYKVERVFGSIKRWFKSPGARYVGESKTHFQHLLEAISYNLYRFPRLPLRPLEG
jgi:IS5 family transposase